MKIPKTEYDTIVEVICILCLLGVSLYIVNTWGNIPSEIPGHYNAAGEIDKMTSKSFLIVLIAITWLMYIGMTIIERYPQIWNTGVAITPENKDRIYRTLKDMMKTIKLVIVVIFSYLIVNSAIAAPLPKWSLVVILALIFGPLIFFMAMLIKRK